jgi:serine protease Do
MGHVITNFHCVYKQESIKLIYYDKDDWQTYDVEVIGTDPLADLALLKVLGKEEKIPYLKFAPDMKNIPAGTEVFALGHPMGMVWTVTKGIVSSNARFMRHPYIKALQTDAAINKGNSGGPLMNMRGEIVGINAMMMSRTNQSAGVGLAIRGDIVKDSYETMIIHGKVDRPAVGIQVMAVGTKKHRDIILKKFPDLKSEWVPNTRGLFVGSENKDNPKNIKQFDTIIGIGGVLVNTGLEFSDELIKYDVGETIFVMIVRKKVHLTVETTLKVFPVETEKLFKILMPIRPPKIEEKKSPEPKK